MSEPLIIETKGTWQPFEAMTQQELEVGHTYNIEVQGVCEFAILHDRPSGEGLSSNNIKYKKEENKFLWIKTGG